MTLLATICRGTSGSILRRDSAAGGHLLRPIGRACCSLSRLHSGAESESERSQAGTVKDSPACRVSPPTGDCPCPVSHSGVTPFPRVRAPVSPTIGGLGRVLINRQPYADWMCRPTRY